MKRCSGCRKDKPVGEFGLNRAKRDGRQTLCVPCQRTARARTAARDPDAERRWGRTHRAKLKAESLRAYGEVCACCGESEPVFLCLDHPNGLPDEHRDPTHRSGRLSGDKLLRLLRSQGWPPGYRTLCWNCNSARAILGQCPHERVMLHAVA
jgi:hypothetical protein